MKLLKCGDYSCLIINEKDEIYNLVINFQINYYEIGFFLKIRQLM